MKEDKTNRGFDLVEFTDRYGAECSLQKSSLATEDAIWLGVNDGNPQVLASKASSLGVHTTVETGWVPYPVPEEVLVTTRMHLTVEQVKALLPYLQRFVETGEILDSDHMDAEDSE